MLSANRENEYWCSPEGVERLARISSLKIRLHYEASQIMRWMDGITDHGGGNERAAFFHLDRAQRVRKEIETLLGVPL